MDKEKIKKKVQRYVRKFGTNNPFELADCLNVKVFRVPLGNVSGFYRYMKKHRCIYINSQIEDDRFLRLIMAHELGHALLHSREKTYFMEHFTLLNVNRYELEANLFAVELLLDSHLMEHEGATIEQIARISGYSENLIKLKLENT